MHGLGRAGLGLVGLGWEGFLGNRFHLPWPLPVAAAAFLCTSLLSV